MVVIVVDFVVTAVAVAAAVFVVLVVVMLTAKFVAVNYKTAFLIRANLSRQWI